MKDYLLKKHNILGPVLVFVVIFVAMMLYQFVWIGPDRMAGNDSYSYLAKSKILQEYGPKTASFANILPFSLWHELGTDNTIVYDGLIILLTFSGNEIVSAKIVVSLLASVISMVFFYGLTLKTKNGYKIAAIVLCGFFVNYAFFLKFTELRSLVFSIMFYYAILAGLFFAKDKFYLFILLGAMYTLLHTTTFLAFIPIVILFVLDGKNRLNYVRAFVYLLLGTVFALLVFPLPNFWEMFLLQPLVPLLYLSSDFAIDGAFEAKGDFRTPYYLLIANTFNVIVLIAGILIYLWAEVRKQLSSRQLASFVLLVTFVLLDFLSRRFSDYLTPVAFIFIGMHIEQLKMLFNKLREIIMSRREFKYTAVIGMVVIVIAGGYLFYDRFLKDNLTGKNYQGEVSAVLPEPFGAAKYMVDSLPHNAYIYNAAWEDFPYFLYYAPRFKYAAGAEPGFMYLYDKEMLRFYQDFRAFRNFELIDNKLVYKVNNTDFRLIVENQFNTTVMTLKKGKSEKMTNYILENYKSLSIAKLYEDDFYVIIGLVP